jgi:hypothetical protein
MPGDYLHPDTVSWIARVAANGGSVSRSTVLAVNSFCNDIDLYGLRRRFYRLNLLCGSSLQSALVPLFVSESANATNRGFATDTNVSFVSADYAETGASAGLNARVQGKYLDTGVLGNIFEPFGAHLACGMVTPEISNNTNGFRCMIGLYRSSTTIAFQLDNRRGNANLRNAICGIVGGASPIERTAGGTFTALGGAGVGYFIASWPSLYKNGVELGSRSTLCEKYSHADTITVWTQKVDGVANSGVSTVATLGWYSIGLNLDAAQAGAFDDALRKFAVRMQRRLP